MAAFIKKIRRKFTAEIKEYFSYLRGVASYFVRSTSNRLTGWHWQVAPTLIEWRVTMGNRGGRNALVSTCLLMLMTMFADESVVRASVRMDRPEHHFYTVEMIFPASQLSRREVQMAVWTPGSYKIRDFAKNVEGFGAFDLNGNPLSWSKTNKSTWVIAAREDEAFKISYRVFAYEHTVRTSYLDKFYGFINPASVFFYEQNPEYGYQIDILPPDGWQVVGALPQKGYNRFVADSWDQLVDAPFQFGRLRSHNFEVNGIPHLWVIAGDVNMDEPAMVRSLEKIGVTVGDLFGHYPFDNYTIFSAFRLTGAGGGLEHQNSTMVMGSSMNFRDKRGWDRFLGLIIHEYVHAWNVKAIRDRVLGPFDYQKEVYTELLWMHEGWTSYYDDMLMARAGFWDEKELRKSWSRQIERYLNQPGKSVESLADASFDAWIHQYQPSETRGNSQISYYSAGALSGLALDLLIRNRSKNAYSLDDVLRTLYEDYGRQRKGIVMNDVIEVVSQYAGKAGKDFFYLYIMEANPLPLETYLEYAGLEMVFEDPTTASEKDESAEGEEPPPYQSNPKVDLGIRTRSRDGAVYVADVVRNGPGWQAGLDFHDEILAINDRRVDAQNYEKVLGWSRPGDEVVVVVSRLGKILYLPIQLEPAPRSLKLVPMEDADDLQQAIYTAMFKPLGDESDDDPAQ